MASIVNSQWFEPSLSWGMTSLSVESTIMRNHQHSSTIINHQPTITSITNHPQQSAVNTNIPTGIFTFQVHPHRVGTWWSDDRHVRGHGLPHWRQDHRHQRQLGVPNGVPNGAMGSGQKRMRMVSDGWLIMCGWEWLVMWLMMVEDAVDHGWSCRR